jgi:hypothetical protein
MSLAEGWRTFNFFNNVPLPDPHDPSKKAVILQVFIYFFQLANSITNIP